MQMSDSERISKLVSDTVSMLCKNSVHFSNDLKIQGLIAVTSDSNKIYVIEIRDVLETVSGSETGQEIPNEPAKAPVRRRLVMQSGSPPKKMMALMAPNSVDSSNNLVQRNSNTFSGQKRTAAPVATSSKHLNPLPRIPQRAQRPMLALPAPNNSTAIPAARFRPSNVRCRQPGAALARQVSLPTMRAPGARKMNMVVGGRGRSGNQMRMAMPAKQPGASRSKMGVSYMPRAASLRAARLQQIKRIANNRALAAPIVMPSPRMLPPSPLSAGQRVQRLPLALPSPGNQAVPIRLPGCRPETTAVQIQTQGAQLSLQSATPYSHGPMTPRMLPSRPEGNKMQPSMSPQTARFLSSQIMTPPRVERPPQSSMLIVQRNDHPGKMQLSSPMTSSLLSLPQQSPMSSPRIVQPLMVLTSTPKPIHNAEVIRSNMLMNSNMQASYPHPLISTIASHQALQVVASPQKIAIPSSGVNVVNLSPMSNPAIQSNQCGKMSAPSTPQKSNFQVKLIGILPPQLSVNHTQSHSLAMPSPSCHSSKLLPVTVETGVQLHSLFSTVAQSNTSITCAVARGASTVRAPNSAQQQAPPGVVLSSPFCASLPLSTVAGVLAPPHASASSSIQTMQAPFNLSPTVLKSIIKREDCGYQQQSWNELELLTTTSQMKPDLKQLQVSQQQFPPYLDQSKNIVSPMQRPQGQQPLVTGINQTRPIQMANLQHPAVQRSAVLQANQSRQPTGLCVPVVLASGRSNQSEVSLQLPGNSEVLTVNQQKDWPAALPPQNVVSSVMNQHGQQQKLLPPNQLNLSSVNEVRQSFSSSVQSLQTAPHLIKNLNQMMLPQWNQQSNRPLLQPNIPPVLAGGRVCLQQASQLEQSPKCAYQRFGAGLVASQMPQNQGPGQKIDMNLQGIIAGNFSDSVKQNTSTSVALQFLNQPGLRDGVRMASSAGLTTAVATVSDVVVGVGSILPSCHSNRQLGASVLTVPAVTTHRLQNQLHVATESFPDYKTETLKRKAGMQSQSLLSLSSSQLSSPHTAVSCTSLSSPQATTVYLPSNQQTMSLNVNPGAAKTVNKGMSQADPVVDLDMPCLSPVVTVNVSGDVTCVTNQKSAMTSQPKISGLNQSRVPSQNLKAFIQNILVNAPDASAGLLDAQFCKPQSKEKREKFQEPSSTSLTSASKIDSSRVTEKHSDASLKSSNRPLNLAESLIKDKFDLDAFAVSQVEKLVRMRQDEKLNVPEAESTSMNIQPPGLQKDLEDRTSSLSDIIEQTANEDLLPEHGVFSDMSQTVMLSELPRGDAARKTCVSPSSTIAYSESPLRLSVSDLEEFEQNLANMTDNFNPFEEENSFRFRCRCRGCRFCCDDEIEFANHYSESHTGDVDIDPVAADQRYMPLLSSADSGINSLHELPSCPFPGCGRSFAKIGAVTNHYQKAHKTSLTKKQKASILSKVGLLHRCEVCSRGFGTKADLQQHITKKRHGK